MKILRETLSSYRNEMVAAICHTVHVEESDDNVKVNPYRFLSVYCCLASLCRDTSLYIR